MQNNDKLFIFFYEKIIKMKKIKKNFIYRVLERNLTLYIYKSEEMTSRMRISRPTLRTAGSELLLSSEIQFPVPV